MNIGDICNAEVITVRRNTTVLDAAIIMREKHVGDVVVIEAHKEKIVPIGIVTDRDIVVEVVATALDYKVITVGDIMVPNVVVVKENMDVLDVIQIMKIKGIRRLPVVDNEGELEGVIALDDLLALLAKELGLLSKSVIRQQNNESKKRR